ncbi:trypsin-1-like [Phlebotomus argentipes]|uniref:trypsin-1-like n=1 Tax=Phlebotomus argentipes TaxID=94469 RepID=UPI00289326C5|nr:trypsin-1-like [Phlebotomus argentipes]
MKVFFAVLALVSTALAAPADVSTPKLAFVNERITNGQDAAFGEFPYICSMHWVLIASEIHVCGASIINPNWILTAAHCFTEIANIGVLDAVCGITDLTINDTQQRNTITEHIIHPDYPGGVAPNDIAVGRLAGILTFNANIQPINLPTQGQEPILDIAVLAGWGSTSTTNVPNMPNRLQRAIKTVRTFQQCCDLLNSVIDGACNILDTTNVCAGDGPISACSGDSGGPLSQLVGGTWTQIGVVSWGITPCGTTVAPSVFVMVSSFRNWIDANIQ